jgi:hypothetical protein
MVIFAWEESVEYEKDISCMRYIIEEPSRAKREERFYWNKNQRFYEIRGASR